EYAWKHVIRPTLMDNVGWAIIMSTPNAGLDGNQAQRTPSYFNLLCLRIQEGAAPPEWAYWHRTARDNPKILPSEFQALINEYAEKGEEIALQEEVYALLLTTGAGLAFPEWNPAVHVARYDPPPGAGYWVGGLDWGCATWGQCVMVWMSEGRRLGRREGWDSELRRRQAGLGIRDVGPFRDGVDRRRPAARAPRVAVQRDAAAQGRPAHRPAYPGVGPALARVHCRRRGHFRAARPPHDCRADRARACQ